MSTRLFGSGREDAARPARAGRPARAFFVAGWRRLRALARRTDRGLRRVEIGLWATGAVLVTAAVGVRADAGLYQWRAGRQLEQVIASPAPAPNRAVVRPAIAEGTPIARLRIPRLGLETIVAEGVGETVLSRAVGHLPSSARPGEAGNVALAGHRDTFFRPLEGIRSGDLIRLEQPSGAHEYRVEWTSVVAPDEVEVLADTGYPSLTLVTCYPFRYVGPAPDRFIVRARAVGAPESDADAPAEDRQFGPMGGAVP
jgi:sortase A